MQGVTWVYTGAAMRTRDAVISTCNNSLCACPWAAGEPPVGTTGVLRVQRASKGSATAGALFTAPSAARTSQRDAGAERARICTRDRGGEEVCVGETRGGVA